MDYCYTQRIKTSQQILSQFVSIESHKRNFAAQIAFQVVGTKENISNIPAECLSCSLFSDTMSAVLLPLPNFKGIPCIICREYKNLFVNLFRLFFTRQRLCKLFQLGKRSNIVSYWICRFFLKGGFLCTCTNGTCTIRVWHYYTKLSMALIIWRLTS